MFENPLPILNSTNPPSQKLSPPDMLGLSTSASVTSTELEAVHPLLSVTVTVYVPVSATLMENVSSKPGSQA